ncbi:hypothetical protein RM844_04565 [Streptomyces sp. DSM 44915]|uniref:DUF2273 domain-containing protein n=1 Tax=Streptomyces chisholmiae TaxID=3075540 RepID=A0ABU2JKP9_9ACTN|nr:hypothetical protein [Streptomyces sp. DSM 44915]MDT0265561.1 hypothetical protein [Streptomyces sp. DSM 44915]
MVTLSLVVIFGALVGFLLKFHAIGFGAFLAAALFGFYLAETGAADTINDAVTSLVEAVSSIGTTGKS